MRRRSVVEFQRLLALRSARALLVIGLIASCLGFSAYAAVARELGSAGLSFAADELVSSVTSLGSAAPIAAGLVAALAIGGDRRHGVLARTVLITPDRRAVIVARLVASLAFAIALSAACWVVGAALTYLLAGDFIVGPLSALAVVDGVFSSCLFAMTWTALVSALALTVRSSALVAVLCVSYPLFIEPTFRAVASLSGSEAVQGLTAVLPWSLGAALQQRFAAEPELGHIVTPNSVSPGPFVALMVLVGLAVLAKVFAIRSFERAPIA